MKQTYNKTTKEMDFELCNLIDDVGYQKAIRKASTNNSEIYTPDDFEVKDPKSVNEGTMIDIDKHFTTKNKGILKRHLTIYFCTKENKVMVHGPDLKGTSGRKKVKLK